jgi:hypothetical protein
MNFDNNIRQKQDFSDMNIGKILFCFRLQSKSCPKGAAHLLRECGFFARLVCHSSLKYPDIPTDLFLLLALTSSHHAKEINEFMT